MQSKDALAFALKLLAGRDKSETALRAALERKGCESATIDTVIQRCRELGYVDDARLAQALSREALADGWVGEALSQRLVQCGLDESLAADAAQGACREVDLRALARALVVKRRLDGVKAARFLGSRGFDEELIRSIVALE